MSNQEHISSIAITGRGMVSSLGCNVVTSCAAARAGIVRSDELDYPVRSPDDGEVRGLIGYPLPELTRGFEGFARLLRITQAALADLQKQVPQAPWQSTRTAFYLSLPDPRRIYTGLDLIPDDDTRKALVEEAENLPPDEEPMGPHLLQTASRLNNWTGEPSLRFVTTSGHTGVAQAVQKAMNDLREGQIELAVVGGIDSLLDENTLAWLENTGRLKTPAVAAGVPPGEAGAFLLLETLQHAKARDAHIFGVVGDVRMAEEPKTLLSGDPPTGQGLTEVITAIMEAAGWNNGQPVWLITDQNGELYRAKEWGNAIFRLVARSQAFAEPKLWYPATSFGDTAAAVAVASACMATSAFERGYAFARSVAIVSSSETELRTSILIKSFAILGALNSV